MAAKNVVDKAFVGVGTTATPGLDIWSIHNLLLTPIPKTSHGKFFSRCSYIVLNTVLLNNGCRRHYIHYWLGKDSDKVDSTLASDKAVELDAILGSCAIQYREIQGCETDMFLSYFKPCIIPIEGLSPSDSARENYKTCLLRCRGEHAVSVVQVPFSRSSLNQYDAFILDTEVKIYLFCGAKSSIQQRAKALEVVQYIKDRNHGGRCEFLYIDGGKFVADAYVGEFWSLFGGYAPLIRELSKYEMQPNKSRQLYWINKGKISPLEITKLEKSSLTTDWCYMLDCRNEVFVWMGRNTRVTERKMSITATESLLQFQNRLVNTHIIILTQGYETPQFMLHFDEWPKTTETSLYEDGLEKVAAIFKYQGYEVKELADDDYEPIIDSTGDLKVWLIDLSDISLVPVSEQGKLYSGNCYVVQYIYSFGRRDDIIIILYSWIGRSSAMEDRTDVISHMIKKFDSTKGRAVMAKVFEGKEPVQFYDIFKSLIIFKGGTSSAYKRSILERGCADETYTQDKPALFRIQVSGRYNMQAIQVDLVSGSLNSSYCYILQYEDTMFAWIGNLSSPRGCSILHRTLDFVNPLKKLIQIREGCEPDIFWNVIGLKTEYPKEKVAIRHIEDPHLFSCVLKEDDIKIKEIYTFTQNDLITEDTLVLDCYREIYVWVGQHAALPSKKEAFVVGKKFLEADVLLEGLVSDIAIYVVTEGYEPPFFTCFFDWNPSKCYFDGNSFERKLAVLKGLGTDIMTSPGCLPKFKGYSEYCSGSGGKGYNSDRSHTSVSPTHTRASSSSSPKAYASFFLNSYNNIKYSSNKDEFQEKTLCKMEFDVQTSLENVVTREKTPNGQKTFSYELLQAPPDDIMHEIDISKREVYLSADEFEEKFGMTKEVFYRLPLWRRNKLKKDHRLF